MPSKAKIDFSTVERRPGPETELERWACNFVQSFAWCEKVQDFYSGIAEPGIVGVFLVRIQPARPDVDEWLWVVVGDVPSAYLVTDGAPNPACALDGYIALMQDWVKAVRAGQPVDRLIPVNAPPTLEYAEMLASRLEMLKEHLENEYAEELRAGMKTEHDGPDA